MVSQEEYDAIAQQVQQNMIPQDPQSSQLPYFPPQSSIKETTLVSQTNPQPLLEELSHKLRCEMPETQEDGRIKWVKPAGVEPLLNEKGIHSILVDVYSITNQGTILSNLNEEIVSKIVIEVGKAIVFKLATNWKEYECKKSNLTTIVLTVCNMSYMALRRGMDQGERTFIKSVGRYTEQVAVRPQGMQMEDKKKSLLNPFSWFG